MKNVVHKVKMSVLALFFVAGLSVAGLISPVVQAAVDACPDGGTLNQATAQCEYLGSPYPQTTCPNGGTLSGTTCSYAATIVGTPVCDVGSTWWPAENACLNNSPSPAPCTAPAVGLSDGPGGQGCYIVSAPTYTYTCLSGHTLSGSTCSYTAVDIMTYTCGTTIQLSQTCSYLATVGTMTDSQPSATVAIPNGSTITVDGERGTTTVQTGGKLMGVGKVGVLTVNTGGVVAPGHSPGVLQSGNLTLNGSYEFELGGATPGNGNGHHDQIDVTGTVDVTGATLVATLYGGFVPTSGQVFTIINNDGSDAVTGTFAGIAEGGTYTNQGVTYTVSYIGGTGNDVTLTVAAIDTAQLPAGSNVPTVPNTGFQLLLANPLLTLALSLAGVGIILAIARKLNLRNA